MDDLNQEREGSPLGSSRPPRSVENFVRLSLKNESPSNEKAERGRLGASDLHVSSSSREPKPKSRPPNKSLPIALAVLGALRPVLESNSTTLGGGCPLPE